MKLEDLELEEDFDEVQVAWIQEAERRLALYKAGEMEVVSVEEVFAEGLRRLREAR